MCSWWVQGSAFPVPTWGASPRGAGMSVCSAGDVAGPRAGALPLTGERCPRETLCLPQKNPFPGSQASGVTGAWDNGLKNESIGARSLRPQLPCVPRGRCRGGAGVSPAVLHALGSCFFPTAWKSPDFPPGQGALGPAGSLPAAASGRGISGWGDRATALCQAVSAGWSRAGSLDGTRLPRTWQEPHWGAASCKAPQVWGAPSLSFHLWGASFCGTGSGREQSAADATRPGAAAEAMGAASCPRFFAVDSFQSILPSCCWEPGPLGRGKHSTYQNLGDRFPALWTRCQDRSKSHAARRYHERSLQGSRRKKMVLPEPWGTAAPPSLSCCQLQALCSGKAPQLRRVLWGWSRGDAPGPGELQSLWGPRAVEYGAVSGLQHCSPAGPRAGLPAMELGGRPQGCRFMPEVFKYAALCNLQGPSKMISLQ